MFTGGGNSKPKYPKVFNESEFTTSDHQVLTSTTNWTEIAYYVVLAQQRLRVGISDANHPENEGRVYVILRSGETTPAEFPGKWRIVLKNRARTWMHVVQEFDEELTHGDLNDKRKQIPLPLMGPPIGEDYMLTIEVKPKTAHATAGAGNDNLGWADDTESLMKIPVTIEE